MKKNSFLYGTLVLIFVNFIVRFLGFGYKVVLSRMIGPEAIGLFHLVFPFLMVLITFTSAGIPVAVSKLVAHNLSLNNRRGCNKVLGLSLFIGLVISTTLSIVFFYHIEYISVSIIKNENAYYSLLALIPAVPFITLSSIFRGYYYGIKQVGPPGTSQVLEQVFRILFVVGCLLLLQPLQPKYSSMIAVIGISMGEFIGLICLLLHFKFGEALHPQKKYPFLNESNRNLLGKIAVISIPITITRLIGVIMQSINAVLIPQRLQLVGYTSSEALATFGKLTGMALPLLFLPFVVTSALVVNIIPSVSEEMARENWRLIGVKSNLAIRMTLLVSIPTTAIYIFFSTPLCEFIYNQADVGKYLSLLSYATIFLSLHHCASGILHGLGKQLITTINYLLGMTLQLLCTYFLVSNPKFGVYGFVIGFILSTLIICFLNIISLTHFVKLEMKLMDSIIKPIIATMVMVLLVKNVYQYCIHMNVTTTISVLISITSGLISYMVTIVLSGSISINTLKYIFTKS